MKYYSYREHCPGHILDLIVDEINNRPRKCLKYQTPSEAFREELKRIK